MKIQLTNMINRRAFLFILLLLPVIHLAAQTLNAGTYNIRYDNPGDSLDSWKYRKQVVTELITFHEYDVFGIQEGLINQLNDLSAGLPGYGYTGVGRDDGKSGGEFSAIFYKKSRLNLLHSGTFWLSGTDIHKPNRGWDAVLPRICTWAEFEDKVTHRKFFHFNTHFDHVGVVARRESAALILRMITEIAGRSNVILTGDFNTDQTSEAYAVINNSGKLKDSYETAAFRYAFNGTFNAFNINTKTGSRIDHVFLSPGFKVLKYGILTDNYPGVSSDEQKKAGSDNFPKEVSLKHYTARLPSDHFPVFVKVSY